MLMALLQSSSALASSMALWSSSFILSSYRRSAVFWFFSAWFLSSFCSVDHSLSCSCWYFLLALLFRSSPVRLSFLRIKPHTYNFFSVYWLYVKSLNLIITDIWRNKFYENKIKQILQPITVNHVMYYMSIWLILATFMQH